MNVFIRIQVPKGQTGGSPELVMVTKAPEDRIVKALFDVLGDLPSRMRSCSNSALKTTTQQYLAQRLLKKGVEPVSHKKKQRAASKKGQAVTVILITEPAKLAATGDMMDLKFLVEVGK